jgi:NAD(P)-dependent dehydrogenase (short-subunit alcohol dehydrogenase family)
LNAEAVDMGERFDHDTWGMILGGSSGFGLATAHALSSKGMSLVIVHRDRRGAMSRIEPEFEKIRASGVDLLTFNADALDASVRADILAEVAKRLGERGRIRVLLHSIAFGNLKLIVAERPAEKQPSRALAEALGIDERRLVETADRLLAEGLDALHTIATPAAYSNDTFIDEEDLARTIHSMGTSMLGWTQEILRRGLFAGDARVLGLTSEGNTVAWKGYAAVAAAKVALESIARAIAVEMAPHGIRCNVIQAGITDTPALRLIPGNAHLKAQARLRNPFRRLTTPGDVANVVYLLSRDEAAWINGVVIRVDGGEHVAG